MVIKLESEAFEEGSRIPSKYTCDGENISPHLRWTDVPERTISFAIMCEDPDAPGGIFTHWMISNITPDTRELKQGIKRQGKLENGAVHGLTDFGSPGYGGLCPPRSEEHRYFFKIYALDKILNLDPEFKREEFLRALEGNVLDEGQLMGIYRRK